MKTRNFLKKLLAVVLVFAMLAPIMGNLEANVNEVQAEETSSSSEMLSVKCQVTNGVVTDTSIDKYRNNYVMRFVSSIDSLDYKEVGFEISYQENGETVTKTNRTKTVFKRIESTTGSTSKGRDTYSFSPKVISTASEYFITAKWPVAPADVAVDYTVRAFARTTSGTVYGPARCVSVNDGLTTCKTINMSFENTKGVDLTGVTALKANDYDAEVIGVDDTTVHVRISGVDKSSLKSATQFAFATSDGSTVGSGIYRNLYTKYTGTADTSWYEEYLKADSTETDFTIATSADLYGLADLVNTEHVTFEEKKVFVVSDIAVNEEILVTDQTDTTNYKKWYTYNKSTDEKSYVDNPTYTWTSIGYRDTSVSSKPYYSFKGTFDAQMHTISGLYNNNMRQYGGFFGPLQSNTTIKNLKLENSYFETATTDCGSITGYGAGTLDTVYSNAIVESESYRVGGLVGAVFVPGFQMKSCWYDGIITNTSQNRGTGGLLGTAYSGSDVTMTECLNTGIVDASICTNSIPKSGGLIGDIAGTAVMTDCLNTGTIVGTYGAAIAGCVNGGKLTCNTTYGCGSDNVVTYCSTSNFIVNYNCYAGEDSSTRNNDTCKSVPVVSLSARTDNNPYGTGATRELGGFDFDTVWTVIPNETPVLQLFESKIIDTSWYDENQDIYVLYDKADLWGFSALSQTEDFAGKTIKLGNDIVVNTGVATNWATNAPKYEWIPIGNIDLPFAGTFDGDMHTISGLYLNADVTNSGLFSVTGHTSTVKNLKLTNSYFTSTEAALGSVAGQGRGLFDTVYSDAIVTGSNARVGGLIGMGYGTEVVMQYCQFDGTVTNTVDGSANRGTGGLMGMLYTDANVKSIAQINNCLNNGTVDATASTQPVPKTGGLVGGVEAGSALNIADCLNLGNVNVAAEKWDGLIVGCIDGANVTCSTSYALGTAGTDFIVGWMQNNGSFKIDYILNGVLTQNVERYSTNSTNTTNSYRSVTLMFLTQDSILGDAARTKLAGFNFESTWSSVPDSTPVLNFSEANQETDTRWYDANATEYVLYDEGDLYGFAEVSASTNFANKIVRLGKDIVVNEGVATNWAKYAPSRKWNPISGTFAGTFDGDEHAISGLYLNATSGHSGLFGTTGAASTIKNLYLKNSYFESAAANLGSIAGRAQGTIDSVYSDAIVVSSSLRVGGLVGMGYNADFKLNKCWFAGSVTNTTNIVDNRGTGGLVGVLLNGGNTVITNCLNAGVVNVEAYTYNQGTAEEPNITPVAGGIVGWLGSGATVEIKACLNVGKIQVSEGTTGGYNPMIGLNVSGVPVIYACYATKESCDKLDVSDIGSESVIQVDAEAIKGSAAETVMTLLNWETDWKCVDNDFPVVNLAETTSEGVDYVATETDTALLTALYQNRTLYQGELHDHASNGGSSDGTVPLATWKTQMTNLGLDFAASFDHRQTWHINHSDWDKSLFIYGTEASTNISDHIGSTGDGKLHYNMIFAGQSQMQAVLNSFTEFDYETYADNENSGQQTATNWLGRTAFGYPDFTKARFNELIQAVKAQDGLFVLAHPMQKDTAYFSDNAMDYSFIEDYVGFEVIYRFLNNGYTRENYSAWKELLAAGKRVWATSGGDGHGDLSDETLTSVYAEETAKTEGNLVSYLKDGNFTAGSVGIQMCVNGTPMGGHCDFTGQRLVVDVGEIHSSVYDSTHKYRVDVLNEDGIVYSQMLSVDETTKTATNAKIALDVEECDFYRVEVYDVTDNYRIAYGNPIWNDK